MTRTISLSQKKNIVRIAILIIIFCFLFFLLVPLTQAWIKDDLVDALRSILEFLLGSPQSATVSTVFTGSTWDFFGGGNTEMGVAGTTFFATLGVSIKAIASAFISIKLIMETIQAASRNELNLDFVLKIGIKLSIFLMLVSNLDTVTNALHSFFSTTVKAVNHAANEASDASIMATLEQQLVPGLFTGSFILLIVYMLLMKLAWGLIMFILSILVKIAAFALMLELGIRRIFMPIALLSLLDGAPQSPAVRYLKKYVGIYFKMMIYVVAFSLANLLYVQTVLHGFSLDGNILDIILGSLGIDYLALNIAAFSFSKKSENLVNEMLGV